MRNFTSTFARRCSCFEIHGCGLAVLAGISAWVRTSYVLVAQHDRLLSAPLDVARIVEAMEELPELDPWASPRRTRCTTNGRGSYRFHAPHVRHGSRVCTDGQVSRLATSAPSALRADRRQRAGEVQDFTEQTFGEAQLADVLAEPSHFDNYGTYLYLTPGVQMVTHTNGRFRCQAALEALPSVAALEVAPGPAAARAHEQNGEAEHMHRPRTLYLNPPSLVTV